MKNNLKVININGALVALYQIEGLRAVAFDFRVKAGSWYEETIDTWGIAHLLEHMMFQGTESFLNRDAIEDFKEENGIWCNAWTSGSQVELSLRMPSESAEKGLELAKEMLFRTKISDEALVKQKQVVMQEFEDRISRPSARFWEETVTQRFGKDHLYTRNGIGKPECFNFATRENLESYLQKHFVASNIFVGVAGKFDEKKVVDILRKMLLKSKNLGTPLFKEVLPEFGRKIHYEEKMTTATVRLAWITNGLNKSPLPERLKLGLASYLFGGSSRSVLFREIREKLGLAYSASSGVDYYPTTGVFEVETSIKKENLDKTVDRIRALLDSFVNKKIESGVFERARKYLIMQKEMAYESTLGTAGNISSALFWNGEIVTPEEYKTVLGKITESETRDALKKVILDKQHTETVMMSKD